MKIVLSGSMAFAKEMLEIKALLESKGHVICAPEDIEQFAKGMVNKDNESITPEKKWELIRNHHTMIEENDALLVVNEDKKWIINYIWPCSLIEMWFAFILGKSIYLWNSIPEMIYTDEIKALQPIELKQSIDF